ncbi:uncharacterized protein PITG_22060 [Phytophthora infestans T30-4]|uniref:Uncharacterized protein n=1 Tax=Phytophthora infestans (strain T30-4) TaxID=403677 RepID=D0RLU7_PHYIT|nr:uncharacterized protein PITG_22060 [Phytophthora infestans T30-4]EEY52951.1 conserved hypothetical protein [Phytophthora infestans T30-4]|eukprot:XP_002909983.1 conserved hypothetical protein [Phytophthora infestans T30-4]
MGTAVYAEYALGEFTLKSSRKQRAPTTGGAEHTSARWTRSRSLHLGKGRPSFGNKKVGFEWCGVVDRKRSIEKENNNKLYQARLKDGYKVSRDDVVVNMREPGNLAIAAATVTLASAQVVNPTRMYAVKRLQMTSIMRRAADGCTLVTKTATTHVVEGECWKCKMCTYIDSRVVSYVTPLTRAPAGVRNRVWHAFNPSHSHLLDSTFPTGYEPKRLGMDTAVYAEYALGEFTLKSSRKQRAPTTGGADHTSARWTRSRSLRSGKGRPSSAQGGGFEWCEWWIERGRSRRGTTTSSSKAQGRLQGVKGRRGGEHEGAGKPSERGSNGYAGQRAGGKPYKNVCSEEAAADKHHAESSRMAPKRLGMGTAVYAEYALGEFTLKSSRKQRAPTTGGADHTSARWTRSRSLRSGKGRPSSAQGGGFEWCEWWIERGRSRRGTTTSSSKAQGRLQGVKGRRGGEHEGAGKLSERGSNGYAGQCAGGYEPKRLGMGTAVYAEYALGEFTLKSSRKQRAPTTGGADHTSARWTRSRSLRSGKGRPSSAQGGGFEWCEWWIERGRSRRGTTTSSSKAQGRLQGVKGRRGGEHEGAGKLSERGSNGYAGQCAGGKLYKNVCSEEAAADKHHAESSRMAVRS